MAVEGSARGPALGYRSLVFDCDSTLVAIEGIDELAGQRRAEVQAMTDAAMEGRVPLGEVYGRRLEIISPSRAQVEALGRAYLTALVPDVRETIAALLWLDKEVRVISGGLWEPVLALARVLGLDEREVAAVAVEFDTAGRYRGFDTGSPLARSGGKAEVIRGWRLPRPSLMVGDGVTDLEARDAVDGFCAFAGVVERAAVTAAADHVIRTPSLAPVLTLAASPQERERLRSSRFAGLLRVG